MGRTSQKVFIISATGIALLCNLKTRLANMPADVNQGLLSYEFMDHHLTALFVVWTALCVTAPSVYLAKRRYWDGLKGMLLVSGIALSVLLGFVLYVTALSKALGAVTG